MRWIMRCSVLRCLQHLHLGLPPAPLHPMQVVALPNTASKCCHGGARKSWIHQCLAYERRKSSRIPPSISSHAPRSSLTQSPVVFAPLQFVPLECRCSRAGDHTSTCLCKPFHTSTSSACPHLPACQTAGMRPLMPDPAQYGLHAPARMNSPKYTYDPPE